MDFEIDAGDLAAAVVGMIMGALAELGQAAMPRLAELDSCGDEDAVNIETGLSLEFKEHVDGAAVTGAAAQHPTSATKDAAGQRLDQAGGLDHRYSFHLQRPGEKGRKILVRHMHVQLHNGVIGSQWRRLTFVPESNAGWLGLEQVRAAGAARDATCCVQW